ncbi:DUF4380 domain-containing protein [Curtobacterium sp. MCSS17_011]|uniref:DUF4380 domain-containing protein n=1 Tax=Curtobacterium sp. MCSS17_011 TaxID=2175643 RepID=UPI0015E8D6D7|nr:DUF4380 domain-containing protein [Curtobacterium sp. MCSS17_011]
MISTSTLRLVFAPTLGGRLLALAIDGHELLWQNPDLLDAHLRPRVPLEEWPKGDGRMDTWANPGGSKTWPAPQGWGGDGQWPGPPDPVIDSGAWSVGVQTEAASTTVTMESPDDPRTGLRVRRGFIIPALGTDFREQITFTNVSARTIRWATWEVCQVNTAPSGTAGRIHAQIEVPSSSRSSVIDLGTWSGELPISAEGDTWQLTTGRGVAKRGFSKVPGAVEFRDARGFGLRLTSAPVVGAVYPDGGSQVEIWVQTPTDAPITGLGGLWPREHLAELELLGPLVTLEPGDTTESEIRWTTFAAPHDTP